MSVERVLTVLGNKATRPITDFAMQNTGLGDVYYVDYTNGDDGRAGKSPETAVKTLDYAVGLCTANQGDVIYLQAGHAETLATAAAIALDVAGVTVIGLGEGGDRPTFTFSAVDATMTISGASTSISNVILVPSIDSVVSGIVVSAAGVTVDVEVQDTTDIEFVTAVLTTAGADNLTINMKYLGYSAGNACVAPIQLVGVDTARIYVDFFGIASTAIVNFITTACHNIDITGLFYNIGTSLTRNVVDTEGNGTWAVRGWDGNSDATFSGGDNAAIASDDISAVAAAVEVVDGLHDVPTADAETNLYIRDVVGIKTDAANTGAVANTKSLMAYAKQNVTNINTIDGLHDVPTADAETNLYMRDVIGIKTDAANDGDVAATKSLMAYSKQMVNTIRDNGRGGVYWYLDSGAAAAGTGTSWDDAWDTMAEAVAGAGNYDTILVADGSTYDNAATINITQAGLHIIGTGTKESNFAKAMIYGPLTDHFMTINAHEVWIDNIAFVEPANNYDAIRLCTTEEFYKIKITNCKFDSTDGEYAIYVGDTYDAPDLVVEHNLFRYWVTAAIRANATRAKIENNTFMTLAGAIGINIIETGGDRPDLFIKDNVIQGVNSTDTGIQITNTPNEDTLTLVGNKVINCATPVTLAKYTSWYDGNYWGLDDWRYHAGWGQEAAAARGAVGPIFYYDLNMAATGLDGLSWASAFDTLAAAITAADTAAAADRNWAKRPTVYVSADECNEDITVLPEKTDIVGVGTDLAEYPRMMHSWVIAAAVKGARFFNMGFQSDAADIAVVLPTASHGNEFHDCHFKANNTATHALQITASSVNKIIGCEFEPNHGTPYATAAINLIGQMEDLEIRDCYIDGTIAIAKDATAGQGCRIENCTLRAVNIIIDDDSSSIVVSRCNLITAAASGNAFGDTAMDVNLNLAVGCQLVSADSNGPFPNVIVLA